MSGKIPVVLMFYKRETVLKVLDQVKKYQPEKLFLVADGGKNEREHEKCVCIRNLVENSIDWDCKIFKYYNEKNYGCRVTIPNGITSVFDHCDRAIILEDDCVPNPTFFPFCEEILEKFAQDQRVNTISGSNYLPDKNISDKYSYTFSGYAETCGWATWKRAWDLYDAKLTQWPELSNQNILANSFLSEAEVIYWNDLFDSVYSYHCDCDSWDYQWLFMSFINSALSVVPRNNLITNIGFNNDATHCKDSSSPFAFKPTQDLKFPLTHPDYVLRNKKFDNDYGNLVFYGSKKFPIMRAIVQIKAFLRARLNYNPSPLQVTSNKQNNILFYFNRLKPISKVFGFDRGTPIDRYYIENFLSQHRNDIHGIVLEIGDNTYTKKIRWQPG